MSFDPAHANYCRGPGFRGVAVWCGDIPVEDFRRGYKYTWEEILAKCGDDVHCAKEVISGLAVLALTQPIA